MEENKSENLDKEISEEEKYHNSINMLIAWNSGCIANRHINPDAEREMRIRAYRQLSQENPK